MAEDDKPRSRSEARYGKARERGDNELDTPKPRKKTDHPAEPTGKKETAAEGGDDGMGERHGSERKLMSARHEGERRDMHNTHREEMRAMDKRHDGELAEVY